jgi:hypothetical protein
MIRWPLTVAPSALAAIGIALLILFSVPAAASDWVDYGSGVMRDGVRVPVLIDLSSIAQSGAVMTFWVKLTGPFTESRLAFINNGHVANEKFLMSVDCDKKVVTTQKTVIEWPDGTTSSAQNDDTFSAIVPDSWVDALQIVVCSRSRSKP